MYLETFQLPLICSLRNQVLEYVMMNVHVHHCMYKYIIICIYKHGDKHMNSLWYDLYPGNETADNVKYEGVRGSEGRYDTGGGSGFIGRLTNTAGSITGPGGGDHRGTGGPLPRGIPEGNIVSDFFVEIYRYVYMC
jgi:hypothetical protein